MALVDKPNAAAEREARIKKLQMLSAALGVALPSPVGDVVGGLGDMLDPANRNAKGVAMAALGLLPGVPSSGARRLGGELSEAAKAAAKDMPPFEDQMRMARTILDQQKAEKLRGKLDFLFDADKGLGAVPDNLDVLKRGSVQYMRPSEYLGLAEPLRSPSKKSLELIEKEIDKGGKLGQPRLNVDVVDGVPSVVNHDGRHRMMVLQKKFGDNIQVPVHVLGSGKGRDVAKAMDARLMRPQREADAELKALLERADKLLQMTKDRRP